MPDPAECAQGLTIDDGVLTIATGEPAFLPYVVDDDPTSGDGFEAAVAYAVAEQMGFDATHVTWVRTTFDEAIQPGPKNFDFNIQQYAITPERSDVVTFSLPYYTTNQALVANTDTPAAAASLADVQALKIGVTSGTTSLTYVTEVIQPDSDPSDLQQQRRPRRGPRHQADRRHRRRPADRHHHDGHRPDPEWDRRRPVPARRLGRRRGLGHAVREGQPARRLRELRAAEPAGVGRSRRDHDEWMVTAAGVPTIELDG